MTKFLFDLGRVPGRSSVCAVNEGLPRCFSARSSHDGEHGTSSETDIKRVRIEKAESLRGLGLEPYAYTFDRTAMATDLLREHESLAPGKEAGQGSSVRVAGRIRLRRVLGKLAFAQLQDESGTIQLYFDKRVVGAEGFQRLKQLIDIGDIIGAQGRFRFCLEMGCRWMFVGTRKAGHLFMVSFLVHFICACK